MPCALDSHISFNSDRVKQDLLCAARKFAKNGTTQYTASHNTFNALKNSY